MITIIAQRQAIEVDLVIDELRQRGHSYFRFNADEYGADADLTIFMDKDRFEGEMSQRDKLYSSQVHSAAWLYVPPVPSIDTTLAVEARGLARQEVMGVLDGFWQLMDVTWVNPPHIAKRAENRLWQLRLAQSVGLQIPDTLVTNDWEDARHFVATCSDGAIIKDLATPYAVLGSRAYVSYTRVIDVSAFDGVAETMVAPCLLQERVPKKHEMRVYVIGGKLFAAGIALPASSGSRDDYRHQRYKLNVWPCVLPLKVVERCLAVVELAGLQYAGMDLIMTPEGDVVFLELGPYSSWAWVEKQGNIPITSEFTTHLIAISERGG